MPFDAVQPNILWICTDQQRYDTINALGNSHIHTPHLDRLVTEGVAFTHAFCQTPICTPSRAAFLTGMYPSTVHACTNGNSHWAEAAPLVTKLLADAGYDGGLAGKLHLAGAQGRIEPRPSDDGYRVFHWSHHPMPDWPDGHAYADWVAAQGFDLVEMYRHPERIPPELHQSTWCADMAIEFVQEQRTKPWFMSVNCFDPHAPFNPPQSYLDRYDPAELPAPSYRVTDPTAQSRLEGVDFQTAPRDPETFGAREIKAAYYAMIELIDWNVGRMLEALERSGQRENTLVIFTSDHGETLGDHGLLLKGCRFYEGLVRVPLIMSWPERFCSGLISDALVELIDVAPTLLDAVDLPIASRMQGRSLLPILTGSADPHTHREFVRSEYYHTLNPAERPDIELNITPNSPKIRGSYATMVRDRRYKLVVYHGHEEGELFDLEHDPEEFENLWDHPEYRDIRFALMKRSFDALALAVDIGPEQIVYY
ncbi:MAG: sulfatase-like hydrolase/transferase [Chloroflexi bacterium]|nr:sulfatase-like hydrolase/transferase [Chloroflexota bacterium]